MKKVNPFVYINQYFYTNDNDVHWWIDEDELETFKSDWEEEIKSGEMYSTETRKIKGNDYNKWLIENCPFGDYEGDFVDEECPKCDHILVRPTDEIYKDRFCSNFECDYENEHFSNRKTKEMEERESNKSKPDIKVIENLEYKEFCEKYGIRSSSYTKECVICKKIVGVKSWYLIKGYAVVSYEHDDCKNAGPCVAVPIGKTKETWNNLLF